MILILLAFLLQVSFFTQFLVYSDVYCLNNTVTFSSEIQDLLGIPTERSKY